MPSAIRAFVENARTSLGVGLEVPGDSPNCAKAPSPVDIDALLAALSPAQIAMVAECALNAGMRDGLRE